jgi:hypothetical protein
LFLTLLKKKMSYTGKEFLFRILAQQLSYKVFF